MCRQVVLLILLTHYCYQSVDTTQWQRLSLKLSHFLGQLQEAIAANKTLQWAASTTVRLLHSVCQLSAPGAPSTRENIALKVTWHNVPGPTYSCTFTCWMCRCDLSLALKPVLKVSKLWADALSTTQQAAPPKHIRPNYALVHPAAHFAHTCYLCNSYLSRVPQTLASHSVQWCSP
jgi:hypothetical protein